MPEEIKKRDGGGLIQKWDIDFFKRHENAAAAALYVLLICAAYAPVVFSGRSLQASLYHPYGVTNDWPFGYEGRRPLNTFNINATHTYTQWPLNKLLGDVYRQGELPLWNPYQGVGIPLAGQHAVGAFFPYRILECISPVWTWDYFILGRLWIAGFFTYLFLRLLGLSCITAVIGGMFYMFSGNLVWHINREDMVDVSMTIPLLLFCLERMVQRRFYRDIALAAGAFFLILLGQPEAVFWVMLLGACYIALRVFTVEVRTGTRLLLLVLPIILGIGLSSPLILLFLEMVGNSLNVHTGGSMGVAGTPQAWSYKLSIIFPALFKVPTYYRIWPENGAWDFLGGYTGILPVYLVMLGLFTAFLSGDRSLRRLLVFFAGFAIVIVLKNLGVRPFVWLGCLPVFNSCWSQRWAGPAWCFSFAVAAAIGLEVLRRNLRGPDAGRSGAAGISLTDGLNRLCGTLWRKVPLAALAVFAVISFSLELKEIAEEGNYGNFFAPDVLGGCGLGFGVLVTGVLLTREYYKRGRGIAAFLPLGFVELWYAIPRGYDYPAVNQLWIPVAMGLVVILSIAFERYRPAVLGGIFFIFSHIMVDAYAHYGLPDRYDPFTGTPYVKYLKSHGGHYRVAGSEGILMPNYASALGIQDIHYINTITPSWLHEYVESRLYVARPETTAGSFWFTGVGRLGTSSFPEVSPEPVSPEVKEMLDNAHRVEKEIRVNLPFYSLLGLRYIIVPADVTLNTSALRGKNEIVFPMVYHDEVNIYENPKAFPRAFVVHRILSADSYREAHAITGELGFDVKYTAVLEKPLPAEYVNKLRQTGRSSAVIKQYGPNRVIVDVRTDSPGILVLSDLYYPGWEARVDGSRAEVYRTYGVIRGVFVREGEHTVIFSYSPASFRYGLAACAVSLAICCGCLVIGSRRLD